MIYWLFGIGWLILFISLAVAMMFWIRKRFGKDVIRQNHEVAGFVYAVIGSIFAVNIALVVDTVHDEFILAEKQVAHEAAYIKNLYHLAGWFDNQSGKNLQQQLKHYTQLVIEDEWPKMTSAKECGSSEANRLMNEIVNTSKELVIRNNYQQQAYAELLHNLTDLQDSREQRLHGVQINIPLGLMIVVICGSFIIIGFSLFFAMDNHRMQVVIVSLVSVMVWGNIMMVFSVRYPFNGIYIVPPNAFIELLKCL